MIAPLDPANLTPSASLNRMRIAPLSGVTMEQAVVGKLAFDLLSADAVVGLIRKTPGLALDAATLADGVSLPRNFDPLLVSENTDVALAADGVARSFARRLAYLLLTLKRGEQASKEVRADWDASYWDQWAAVQQIVFGGGLMSGNLGVRTVEYASELLQENGISDLVLRRADHAALLPLIGAARTVPAGYDAAVVFDFGGTAIKRGLALYADDALIGLRSLPTMPSGLEAFIALAANERVELLAAYLAKTMADTWQEVTATGVDPAPVFVASIASYMSNNRPLPRQGGIYSELYVLADDLGVWLGCGLTGRIGQKSNVIVLHDGTAAARAYAGLERAAVIVMGTALGVGFPLAAAGLRPAAASFAVL